MKKELKKKNKSFETAFLRVQSGDLGAEQLLRMHKNAKDGKGGIGEQDQETLLQSIEAELRRISPRHANKSFGPVNRNTRAQLEKLRQSVIASHPDIVKMNKHRSHVKFGGNVLKKIDKIYDYLSYKSESGAGVRIAFIQKNTEDALLEVMVEVWAEKGSDERTQNWYSAGDFDSAATQYEVWLKDVFQE